ncbi:hypothetical protein C8R44DRAFT_258596 [Mycena epipterygia]|nr:hypothetical protein C8R44DRAFT_258596 [Mycena epipterygia]
MGRLWAGSDGRITLPGLSSLYNINERIDPTALTQFLLRHQTIHSISYEARDEFELLAGAQLALPCLARLSCEYTVQLWPLLDAFERSPELCTISIPVDRETPAGVASLKLSLRRLSVSTLSLPTRLEMDLGKSVDDEERLIVGCLYGVDSVLVRCETIDAAQMFIPWLALLPALGRLELKIQAERRKAGHARTPTSKAFLRKTRAAMPWVPEIVLNS